MRFWLSERLPHHLLHDSDDAFGLAANRLGIVGLKRPDQLAELRADSLVGCFQQMADRVERSVVRVRRLRPGFRF